LAGFQGKVWVAGRKSGYIRCKLCGVDKRSVSLSVRLERSSQITGKCREFVIFVSASMTRVEAGCRVALLIAFFVSFKHLGLAGATGRCCGGPGSDRKGPMSDRGPSSGLLPS